MSKHVKNPTQYSDQEILNESFNDAYKVLEVAEYGYDGKSDAFLPKPVPFIPYAYDYVSIAYPDAVTDVFSFKTNGSSGTLVATLTIVYTDSTKVAMTSVART